MNTSSSALRCLTTAFFLALLVTGQAQTQPPVSFSKAFSPSTIGPGSTSTLTFTITNPLSVSVDDVSFADVLPSGLTIASPAGVISDCRGVVSAPDGGSTISLVEGSLGANSSCTIRVNVTAAAPGTYTNLSGDLTSNVGNSGPAEADLTVDAGRPGFSKGFSPSVVPFGGRSTLTFTIDNSLNASGAFNPAFTDHLPAGMVIADPANLVTDCPNVTVTATPGTDVIRVVPALSSSLIAAGATCTVSVDVVGGGTGQLENTSGSLSSSPSSAGASRSSGLATAALTVTADRIALVKSFTNDPVSPGGTVDLEFSIFNLNRDVVTDIGFSDDLDAVLPGGGLIATGLPLSVCGGTLSSPDGGATIEFTGGTLPGSNGLNDGANICTFSVTLQIPADAAFGEFTNATSAITADVRGTTISGAPAADDLTIAPLLALTKSFTDDPVAAGGSVILEYTLTNSNPSAAAGITFSDELTTFLPATVTADLPADGFCGAGSEMDLVSPGTDRLSLLVTGAEVPANSSCTFSVTIDVPLDVPNGAYPSTSSPVTGVVDGTPATGSPASDTLVVVAPPALHMSFTDDPVLAGGTSKLEFTISLNENSPSDATDISFSLDLGAALPGLATTPGLSVPDVCGLGSTLLDSSPDADGSEISLVGGTLQTGQSCTFSLDVFIPAGTASGAYTSTTSSLLATVGGLNLTGAPASDVLDVANLVLTKEFIDDPVIAGGNVTLRYTLTNNSPTLAATSITFEDDLDEDLPGLSAAGLPLSDICGVGSILVGSAGNTVITFVGGSLDPLASCSFDVTLSVPAGTASSGYPSATSDFEAVIDGTAIALPNASDTLTVSSELLQLTKSFTDDPVDPGGTATLEFTLSNLGSSDVTDISFTDDLGTTLPGLVAVGLPVSDICGAGSSLSGTSVLTFSGGSLAAGTDCTFGVTLQVPANLNQATTVTNTTSAVSGLVGNLAVFGSPASDDLNINSPVADAPDVTINQAPGQSDPTNASPINFLVLFSQPVVGFGSGDVVLSSGAGVITEIAPLDGTTYNVAVSGMTEGVVIATVPAGVARNAASVGNNASTSTDNEVKFDTTPPVITLIAPNPQVIECEDPYNELGARAEDDCDGNLTDDIEIDATAVDTSTPGDYDVTYSVTDAAGNSASETRTVTVADTTAPEIALNGDSEMTLECGVDTYLEPGATATDTCDPAVSVTIGGDTVDTDTPGEYVVTYNATDASGNAATQVTRTVTVADTTPPEIELVGGAVVCVIQEETYVDEGAVATDACTDDPAITITPANVLPIDTSVLGDVEITYTATDNAGLTATVTRLVRVIPRFVTVEGVFSSKKTEIKKASTIDGGSGPKTTQLVGSQKEVVVEENVSIDGGVISVTDKTKIEKSGVVNGNVDSGGEVTIEEDTAVDGDLIALDKVILKKNSSITGDVTSADDVDADGDATVGGTITENAAVPPLAGIPLPTLGLTSGGSNVTVNEGDTVTLSPGSYRNVTLEKNATLILEEGLYHFRKLSADEDASLEFEGPTIVNVEKNIECKKGLEMSGTDAENVLIQCDGGTVKLESDSGGDKSTILGTFVAPNATIQVGKNASITGALFGEEVVLEEDTSLTGVIALDQIMIAAADWGPLVLPLLIEPTTPYEEWASHFELADQMADEDRDGLANVLEYLMNTDPHEADLHPLPVIDRDSDTFSWSLPFIQAPEEMIGSSIGRPVIEVSDDLIRWKAIDAKGMSQSYEDGVLTIHGPIPGKSLYLRLGVDPRDPEILESTQDPAE